MKKGWRMVIYVFMIAIDWYIVSSILSKVALRGFVLLNQKIEFEGDSCYPCTGPIEVVNLDY